MTNPSNKLFDLGDLVATPAALDAIRATGQNITETLSTLLTRHVLGDWADMSIEDQKANLEAIPNGCRIVAAYNLTPTSRLFIVTESDRSVTTILLPEEY